MLRCDQIDETISYLEMVFDDKCRIPSADDLELVVQLIQAVTLCVEGELQMSKFFVDGDSGPQLEIGNETVLSFLGSDEIAITTSNPSTVTITLSDLVKNKINNALVVGDDISLLNNDVGYITGISWGDIGGTLSDQTDLINILNNKFDTPTGTTSQYIRGDGSLATYVDTTYSEISVEEINSAVSSSARLITGRRINEWIDTKGFATEAWTNSNFFPVPTGTTSQYIRGDGSLSNFPIIPTAFTGLTDTPSVYTGAGKKVVRVKEDETGLDFFTELEIIRAWISPYDEGLAVQQYPGFVVTPAMTMVRAWVVCTEAPTGDDIEIDMVNQTDSNTTIASFTISANTNKSNVVTTFLDTVSEGDVIIFDCTQIGSSNAGTGLQLYLEITKP